MKMMITNRGVLQLAAADPGEEQQDILFNYQPITMLFNYSSFHTRGKTTHFVKP